MPLLRRCNSGFHPLHPISACGSITQGAKFIPITDALSRTGVENEERMVGSVVVQLLVVVVIDTHARLTGNRPASSPAARIVSSISPRGQLSHPSFTTPASVLLNLPTSHIQYTALRLTQDACPLPGQNDMLFLRDPTWPLSATVQPYMWTLVNGL